MAKAPTRRAPQRRGPVEPRNQSKAAGAPAPTSAAASAPGAGSYYVPSEEMQHSPLADLAPRAAFNLETEAHSLHVDPNSDTSVDGAVAEGAIRETVSEEAELRAKIAEIRQIRRPIGSYSQKLALPERRGYKRHWFNDQAGRVEDAEANGWAFIQDRDGHNLKRCVGTGRDKNALYAYAMELPLVFWQEDMAARHAEASAKMDSVRSKPFMAKPGVAQKSDSQKFYDPNEAGVVQIDTPERRA